MSFGKMNTFVDLIRKVQTKDDDGFISETDEVIVSFRAYYEPKHGSEKWVNRSQLFSATALFRFRKIPNVDIKNDMVLSCKYGRFEITSIEDVKGRGMYTEVLGKILKQENL